MHEMNLLNRKVHNVQSTLEYFKQQVELRLKDVEDDLEDRNFKSHGAS